MPQSIREKDLALIKLKIRNSSSFGLSPKIKAQKFMALAVTWSITPGKILVNIV